MTPKTADFSHIFSAVFLAQEYRNGRKKAHFRQFPEYETGR
jgi:hypothetical protein